MIATRLGLLAGAVIAMHDPAGAQAVQPTITKWKFNLTNATGTSTNAEVNSYINTIPADVLEVWYTSTNVYVRANSMPSHSIGPWTGRTVYPPAQNNVWVLLRTPPSTSVTHPALPLGAMGVFVNGVQLFSWSDATSYNNQDIWHNVAPVARADIDSAGGHPSPGGAGAPPAGSSLAAAEGHTHAWTDDPDHTHEAAGGVGEKILTAGGAYHYHTQPPSLRAQLGDTGAAHSPILGWSFDGCPIYGPYGYSVAGNSGSAVRRIESSYVKRNITQRTTLPNGTVLPPSQYGPTVSATYPLGRFAEDYSYSGTGDLDVYNGRNCVTPEYPLGTYAYFATIEANGDSAFPYTIGPDNFFASLIAGNMGPGGGNASIPAGAEQYNPANAAVADWEKYE